MNAPTLALLDAMAQVIRNGHFANLQLYMSNMAEYSDGGYVTIKEVKHFADALITASRIKRLGIELDACYFQQVILPAIEGSQPLRACTELNLNFVNGGETVATLSETDITHIFEHFGSLHTFKKINLNLQNLRAHSFRPFAYSLETFLEKRRLAEEVTVELCSDKEALFAELLTSFAVAVPRGKKTKITYYVTGTRPKKGYANVLEERLTAAGIDYKLDIGDKEDSFTWILIIPE